MGHEFLSISRGHTCFTYDIHYLGPCPIWRMVLDRKSKNNEPLKGNQGDRGATKTVKTCLILVSPLESRD